MSNPKNQLALGNIVMRRQGGVPGVIVGLPATHQTKYQVAFGSLTVEDARQKVPPMGFCEVDISHLKHGQA